MTNKLQQYFPMIRTREEVLNEIESKSRLKNLFYEWTEENQNEFLDEPLKPQQQEHLVVELIV